MQTKVHSIYKKNKRKGRKRRGGLEGLGEAKQGNMLYADFNGAGAVLTKGTGGRVSGGAL